MSSGGNLLVVNITAEHIAYKKKIGTLRGKPVIEIATTGGLHLLVISKADGVETIGAGPHKAVARHIAKKKHPEILFSELSKSDWVDPACFQHLLPQWEGTTERIRSLK